MTEYTEPEKPKPPAPTRKKPDPEGSIIPFAYTYKTAQGKTRTEKRYKVRKRFTTASGEKREKLRIAHSFNEALAKRREIQDEIKRELETGRNQKPITFNELADYFEREYVKPARFRGNEKIEGMRENLYDARRHILLFRASFGSKLLKNISYNDLKEYKKKRLNTPVEKQINVRYPIDITERPKHSRLRYRTEKQLRSTPRALASVNRELSRLRKMLNVAVEKDWIDRSPFRRGEPLIKLSAETVRIRILSDEEETRLLAECRTAPKSAHLKAVIIFAIDCFMRKGEIFGVRWENVDLDKRRVNIPKELTKSYKARFVPLSSRVLGEFTALRKNAVDKDLVFGYKYPGKTSFPDARKRAGLDDLHFHDLRATGITRLLLAGEKPNIVMKYSGHQNSSTFQKYIRVTDEMTLGSASLLDAYYEKRKTAA